MPRRVPAPGGERDHLPRQGAARMLRICFGGTIALAAGLAFAYQDIVPLTICCLTVAVALVLGFLLPGC
jgi:hypothetical protein